MDRREEIARLCLLHMFGLEYRDDSLIDEAERIFTDGNPKAIRAVALADAIQALSPPATETGIPEGMVAWHGGDSAPADWDGGPVLWDDGTCNAADTPSRAFDWTITTGPNIIAYTPEAGETQEATPRPANIDEATLRNMLRELIHTAADSAKWSAQHGLSVTQVGAFLRGTRPAEPKLLKAIGAERVVSYRVLPRSMLASFVARPATAPADVEQTGRYRVMPVKGHPEKHAVFDIIMGDAIAVCPDEVAANKVLAALTVANHGALVEAIDAFEALLATHDEDTDMDDFDDGDSVGAYQDDTGAIRDLPLTFGILRRARQALAALPPGEGRK